MSLHFLHVELDALDSLSRWRALTDGESLRMEQLIRLTAPKPYKRAPWGVLRELARDAAQSSGGAR